MTKISERWKHSGIVEGYCNICGKYDVLTKDHVPPKCAITLGPILQKTVSEFFNTKEPVKPLRAKMDLISERYVVTAIVRYWAGLIQQLNM